MSPEAQHELTPRATSRSSARACSTSACRAVTVGRRPRARTQLSDIATSRWCAPSWRSRSRRRRSLSAAAMTHAREARTSASWTRASAASRSLSSTARRRPHRLAQIRLVEQSRVVDESRNRLAVRADLRYDPPVGASARCSGLVVTRATWLATDLRLHGRTRASAFDRSGSGAARESQR
jgi:hypothetical protein